MREIKTYFKGAPFYNAFFTRFSTVFSLIDRQILPSTVKTMHMYIEEGSLGLLQTTDSPIRQKP